MKIGLVRRGYSASGGAEAYLRRFASAAHAAGHDTMLFHGTDWPETAWTGERIIIRESNSPHEFANALRDLDPKSKCDFLFSFERVWACDAYRAGDGVHASWLKRRRDFEPFWKGWARSLRSKHRELVELERSLFQGGAACIIANSQMVKDEIVSYYQTPPERIQVVHNGLPKFSEVSAKNLIEIRREHGLREKDFVILFAGSGWQRKGLKDAVTAVSSLPKGAVLLVAGKGDVQSLPKSGRVRLLGAQSQEQLHELFAIANVFLLPTYYEPFSNACLEALAMGVPVITTTANGFSEIIEPGVDGEVITAGAHQQMVDVLSKWMRQPQTPEAREKLRQKAAQFSMEKNFAETFAVISQLHPR